jgi:hypothetical protein
LRCCLAVFIIRPKTSIRSSYSYWSLFFVPFLPMYLSYISASEYDFIAVFAIMLFFKFGFKIFFPNLNCSFNFVCRNFVNFFNETAMLLQMQLLCAVLFLMKF